MRLVLAAILACLLCAPASAERRKRRDEAAQDTGRLADQSRTYAGKTLRCPKGFHAVASEGPTLKLPKAEEQRDGRRGRQARKRRGDDDGPPLVRSRGGKEESEEASASTGQRCVPDAPSAKKDDSAEQPALDPIPALEKDAGAAVPQLPLPPP